MTRFGPPWHSPRRSFPWDVASRLDDKGSQPAARAVEAERAEASLLAERHRHPMTTWLQVRRMVATDADGDIACTVDVDVDRSFNPALASSRSGIVGLGVERRESRGDGVSGVFTSMSVGWSSYPFSSSGLNPQSFPLTVLMGMQGQILSKVSGLASLGHSNPLIFDEAGLATGGLFGVVGQMELQWTPAPTTGIGGGFQNNFSPSPLYQFVGRAGG